MRFLQSVIIIPRGPRTDFLRECSCANSCEKVLELLFQNDDKITFEEIPLSFNLPLVETIKPQDLKNMYQGIRNIAFTILENRELSFPTRLIFLGRVLQSIKKAKEENRIIDYNTLTVDFSLKDMNIARNTSYAFEVQERLASYFAEKSTSIQTYFQKAYDYYHAGNLVEQYQRGKDHLRLIFPNIEIIFEKMIINHVFFKQFPFSTKGGSLLDEFLSLCGVYLFIRYLAIGYMADRTDQSDFVDVMASSFRLIDHTNFNRNIEIIMHHENIDSFEQLAVLIHS